MKTALVLIEFQNDYFPNGRMPLEKSTEASVKAQEVLQAYRANKLPIIHIQHISTRPDATHCLPCTKGVEFHAYLQPIKEEPVIKKHYSNSFKDTGLFNYLVKNQITHLAVAGMRTHMGVDATTRAASDLGFGCIVLHDACAAPSLEFQGNTVSAQNVQTTYLASLYPLYANVINVREFLQGITEKSPLHNAT